jgi:hypothetical protein
LSRVTEGAEQFRALTVSDASTAEETMARAAKRRHDEGSGANETTDGLDELQEAARHGAEDVPDKRTTLKDIPVFDRAGSEPKV